MKSKMVQPSPPWAINRVKRNEFKRVKHGHLPGDVHKGIKIAMREKLGEIIIAPWHTISEKAAKVYRKIISKKSKKRQRRRDKERVKEELEG